MSWVFGPGGGSATTPGGADKDIQFNNNGSFSGSALLTTDGSGSLSASVHVSASTYYGDGSNLTGITVGDFSSGSFTGTPEEIQQHLTNINQTRDYLFKSGLTNLQGTIDKEIQTLKNEGTKEITKIAKEWDIYQSLVGSFYFS